jgi:hypothetical protein
LTGKVYFYRFGRLTKLNTMKKISLFVASTFLILLSSCGPSAEQKAQLEQARAIQVQDMQKKLDELNNLLIETKANLEVAKSDMGSTKDFHFLRTEEEKSQQIKEQSVKIQSIEKKIEDISQEIASNKYQLADLQNKKLY